MGTPKRSGDLVGASISSNSPSCGSFGWLDLTPDTVGHEQIKRRPALVISRSSFSKSTPFAVVCPITSTETGSAFHIEIPRGLDVSGFVLVDQIRSVDYKERNWEFICQAPQDFFVDILRCTQVILYPQQWRYLPRSV